MSKNAPDTNENHSQESHANNWQSTDLLMGGLIAASAAVIFSATCYNLLEDTTKKWNWWANSHAVSIPIRERVILTAEQINALIEENAKLKEALSEITEEATKWDIWWNDEVGTIKQEGFHKIKLEDFREL